MLRIQALAVSIMATSALATDGWKPQTIEGDFENYIQFRWAGSICIGFDVDQNQVRRQIEILGRVMGLTEIEISRQISLRSEQARLSYDDDAYAHCANLRELFHSYDPAHLLQAGITPGRFP